SCQGGVRPPHRPRFLRRRGLRLKKAIIPLARNQRADFPWLSPAVNGGNPAANGAGWQSSVTRPKGIAPTFPCAANLSQRRSSLRPSRKRAPHEVCMESSRRLLRQALANCWPRLLPPSPENECIPEKICVVHSLAL